MYKIVIAVLLLVAAVYLGISKTRDLRTLPPSPPPPVHTETQKKVQAEQNYRDMLQETFLDGLEPEKRAKMQEWIAWSPRGKSRQERREHRKALADILDKDERKAYFDIQREYGEAVRSIHEERRELVKEAMAPGEYEKLREMSRERAAIVRARRQAAKGQDTQE